MSDNVQLEKVADKVERLSKEFAEAYRTWCDLRKEVDNAGLLYHNIQIEERTARIRWENLSKELKASI